MRCLADGGRLLEIGKYDILKDTPLGMRPLLRNVAFEGVDLDRIMNDPSHKDEVGFKVLFQTTTSWHACSFAVSLSSCPCILSIKLVRLEQFSDWCLEVMHVLVGTA